MKKCTNCGTEFENEVTVCPNCGHEEEFACEPKKENAATSPVTISTVLGIASIASFGAPNPWIPLILSIIGLVFGVKEKKATGKKLGLIINIITLILSVLAVLALIAYIIFFILMYFTYFAAIFGTLMGGGMYY